MSNSFSSMLATGPESETTLILDAASYGQRVLLQNRAVPWNDPTAYSNYLGQLQALLQPAVALIPLDRMLRNEATTNAPLIEAMGARSRAGFAARTLLGDEELKKQTQALVDTAAKTQREPVVLHLPSPMTLLKYTDGIVNPASETEFDQDDAENAAVYYADWLRAFADLNIAGIVFDEREEALDDEAYKPIMNIAAHYQWPLGLRQDKQIRFLSTDHVVPVLEPGVFTDGAASKQEPSGLVFAEIPEDAVPEQVLVRLGEIRSAR